MIDNGYDDVYEDDEDLEVCKHGVSFDDLCVDCEESIERAVRNKFPNATDADVNRYVGYKLEGYTDKQCEVYAGLSDREE